MTRYLLDSNVFIEAKNRYYGFDLCPGFWEWLKPQIEHGIVASIEEVAVELKQYDDGLYKWAIEQNKNIFLPPDDAVQTNLKNIIEFAHKNYKGKALDKFCDGADCWLIAHALTYEYTVVTQEVLSNRKNEIKIPNVCNLFNVKYINTFDLLRRQKVCFVLKK